MSSSFYAMTRKRPREDDYCEEAHDEEAELFSCSICLETPTESSPPIQCRSGHILCLNCSQNIHSCPVCRIWMDAANPIRCLVAQQIIEKKRQKRDDNANKLLECCGGCGWTGRDKTLLGVHERSCIAALNAKVAQLEERDAKMTQIAAELLSGMKALKSMVTTQKEELNSKKNESAAGAGNIFAAWRACVSTYQSNPVVGANIFVAQNETSNVEGRACEDDGEHFRWLRLHCIVPGIMFLTGAKLEFTALYNPQTLQARNIKRLHINGNLQIEGFTYYLADKEAELSLSRLIQAMQHFAVHGDDRLVNSKTVQLKLRYKAFDEQGKFTRKSNFVSLEVSKSMHTVKKPRTSTHWKFSTDGEDPIFPKLVPERGSLPEMSHVDESKTPSKVLLVSNLPFFCKANDLEKFFTDAGFYPHTCVKPNSTKYKKISDGYVHMNSCTDALDAMNRLSGTFLKGRCISIALE